MSSSQKAAEKGETRKAELQSLTEQLEEQRKLTSQAEQALTTSKVHAVLAVLCCAVLCCAVLRYAQQYSCVSRSLSTFVKRHYCVQ